MAGAAAGGYAGDQVQKNPQQKDVETATEPRWKTVQERSTKRVGYNVSYSLNGKGGVARNSFRPRATLPVKHGQVDTTTPHASCALAT